MSISNMETVIQRIRSLGIHFDRSAWAAASPDKISQVLGSLRRAREGIVTTLNELGIPAESMETSESLDPIFVPPGEPFLTHTFDDSLELSSPGSVSTHSSWYLTPEARTPLIQSRAQQLPLTAIHKLSTHAILLVLTHLTSPGSRIHQYSCDIKAASFHLILALLPQWLEVALDHPFLWGNILRLDSDTLENFRTYIERSNGAPLHLASRMQEEPFTEERMKVWELALSNLKRCASLAFEISSLNHDPRPIRSFLSHSADAVQHLSLHNTQQSYRQNSLRVLELNRSNSPNSHYYEQPWDGIAPNLTSLQLHACQDLFDLHAPVFANLVTLNVSNTVAFNPTLPLPSWLSLLGELISLRHLSIINAILVPRHCEMMPERTCSCSSPLDLLDLTHLSTIHLTSHLLVVGAFLCAIKLSDKIESYIHLHTRNGPTDTPGFLRSDPDHLSFPVCHALLTLPTSREFDRLAIQCPPYGFSVALLHAGVTVSSVALDLTTLELVPGEMQGNFSTFLHLVRTQMPTIFPRAHHLDFSIAVPTGIELFQCAEHLLMCFPNVISWRTDCFTYEQLAPHLFRPVKFRNYPFPGLIRLDISGPVLDYFQDRPWLFESVCRALQTSKASEWRRFLAIDEKGRVEAGPYPWERLCAGTVLPRTLELSIRISIDSAVHSILEWDGAGGLIDDASPDPWDGDLVLKVPLDRTWLEDTDYD